MAKPRILIIDDNPMNVELLGFVLAESLFDVVSAVRAEQALEMIPNFQPDLILMDMHLPGMNGLELTQLIKANVVTQHIVIVAFTASAMKGDEARMIAAGCDGYLSKPIDVDTFPASVLAFFAGPLTHF
jgi:two-component system cell cycle response regulator DivK